MVFTPADTTNYTPITSQTSINVLPTSTRQPSQLSSVTGGGTYAAPAVIFVGEPRHYGAVPGIGEHSELPKAARARPESTRSKSS